MADTVPNSDAPPVLFRSKKRKAFRPRTEPHDDGDDDENHSGAGPAPLSALSPERLDSHDKQGDDAQEGGISLAEVMRLRNARKARLRGVEFGPESSKRDGTAQPQNDERSLVLRDGGAEPARGVEAAPPQGGMLNRFTHQTGLIGDLNNKHMMEFIESKLASRYAASPAAPQSRTSSSLPFSAPPDANRPSAPALPPQPEPPKPQSQPRQQSHGAAAIPAAKDEVDAQPAAMRGRLMEVDLGPEARDKTVALTERARRRLQGDGSRVDDEADAAPRPRKVRLGRDGKPRPVRQRHRRGSDDIKRDKLVDEILHETRLEVYDTAEPNQTAAVSGGEDEDADDRIAEEFRREFLEAMNDRQHRRRKKKAATGPARPGKKDDGEVLRGPKLGGSRNVRAQMRDLLLQKEKEKGSGR